MPKRGDGHGGYCFRCGERRAFVTRTWIGDATFAWTRRHRRCFACGARWATVEVIDLADPLLAEIVAAGQQLVREPAPDSLSIISHTETPPLDWRGARTCR